MHEEPSADGLRRQVRLRSAVLVVVANMIGAGIFTTTGFQAADLGDPAMILGLWVLGGVLALCGALCYGELAAAIPRAGGEYQYLRESYGLVLAFMSAAVSLVAGFSAPIASALKSLVRYAAYLVPALGDGRVHLGPLGLDDAVAIALVWALVAVHGLRVGTGVGFTDWTTLLKVGGILAFIVAAVAIGHGSIAGWTTVAPDAAAALPSARLAAGATSLIFVMFCYSGWNASAYIASEIEDAPRNLPRALLLGTGVVTLLYLGLNAVYFYAADVTALAGKVEVGLVASEALFGPIGATLVVVVLALSLVASASAMTMIGPRVYYAVGHDFPPVGFLAHTTPAGVPLRALVLQGCITSLIILAGRVDQIQQYAGFTLTLFATLAVSSVIVLRWRNPTLPRPFRTWGYPLTPIFFVAVSVWTMIWALRGRPVESLLGLMTVLASGAVFRLLERRA
jgi:APA family basic amino acid/polyamine antiporter